MENGKDVVLVKKPVVSVLGATSYIGAEVLRRLAGEGFEVRGSFGKEHIGWHVDDLVCEWFDAERKDSKSLEIFLRGADGLIYCAPYSPQLGEKPGTAKRNAVTELRTVLEACMHEEVKKVVFVSTAATVQGREWRRRKEGDRSPQDEDSFYLPGSSESAYAEAKAAMEAEVYRYVAQGLAVVIVNPGFVMGPGDGTLENGPLFERLGRGKRLRVPKAEINVVDVRDVADGIVAALKRGRPGRRYLFGGTEVEVEEFFEKCARSMGREPALKAVDSDGFERMLRAQKKVGRVLARGAGIEKFAPEIGPLEAALWSGSIDSRRAKAELGFQTRSLARTIDETISWFQRVGYLT